MLLDWMGGDCSEINRAPFRIDAGVHLTFDFVVMACPIDDPVIMRQPIGDEAKESVSPRTPNPMNVPTSEQAEKYQEQLIPAQQNQWPEIIVSFGKCDNQVNEVHYFPLHQLVIKRPTNTPPLVPLSLPVTITVDRYTLRAEALVLDKRNMIFRASGQVSVSDGVQVTSARSAILRFSGGEPKVEIDQ